MGRSVKSAMILGAGLALSSFSVETRFSPALLAALDPSRMAQALCGGERAGANLAHDLLFASAFAQPASMGATIPLYDDLTTSTFPVTTASAQAKRYFSQGLLLTYGFNHAGAVRSFREAQSLDPGCAMCWWG